MSECASSHRIARASCEKLILYFKEDVMEFNKNITPVQEKAI